MINSQLKQFNVLGGTFDFKSLLFKALPMKGLYPEMGNKRVCFVAGMVFGVTKTDSDYFMCSEFQLHTDMCKYETLSTPNVYMCTGGRSKLNSA